MASNARDAWYDRWSSFAHRSLSRRELAAAERGATDLNLNSVIAASRAAALAEDGAIFHGFESGDIAGTATSSPLNR
jgi:uncharacterized linocin/CFP29 family protein